MDVYVRELRDGPPDPVEVAEGAFPRLAGQFGRIKTIKAGDLTCCCSANPEAP
jgi:hypothetical protein